MITATIPIATTPPTAPPAMAPTLDCVDVVELVEVEVLWESAFGEDVNEEPPTEPWPDSNPPGVVAVTVGAMVFGTVTNRVVGLVMVPEVIVSTVVCAMLFTGKPAELQYPPQAAAALGTSATSLQATETQLLTKVLAAVESPALQ